jgi:hypothetical protein
LIDAAMFFLECTIGPSWAVPMDVGGEHSGTVSGMMNMAGNIGGALSPLVFGVLVQIGSWQAPFIVAAGPHSTQDRDDLVPIAGHSAHRQGPQALIAGQVIMRRRDLGGRLKRGTLDPEPRGKAMQFVCIIRQQMAPFEVGISVRWTKRHLEVRILSAQAGRAVSAVLFPAV